MKNLLPIGLLLVLAFAPTQLLAADEMTEKSSLAKALSQLIGAQVDTNQVWTFSTRQIMEWRGIPDFLFGKMGTKYKRFAYVRYNEQQYTGVHGLIFRVPSKFRKKFKVDFVIADSFQARTDDSGFTNKYCRARLCGPNGNCIVWEGFTTGVCQDTCSSDEDCVLPSEPCETSVCAGGYCMGGYFSAECSNMQSCTSDEECPGGESQTKICLQGQCHGTDCLEVSIEMESDIDCPKDECKTPGDCGEPDLAFTDSILGNIHSGSK